MTPARAGPVRPASLYLDHNATSPLLPEARAAFVDALDRAWGNPSSPHAAGREAASVLDRARRQVGTLVDRDPRSVVFTSGATEANSLALQGLVSSERPLRVVSAIEHPSVRAWGDLVVACLPNGQVDLVSLDRTLSEHPGRIAVVSIMAANNETGVVQPLVEVAACLREHGVPLHVDATQLPGRLPVRVPADLITLSAHKFGGPRGAGCLVVPAGLQPRMAALLRGGPQERGLRGGTENVAACAGMGAAAAAAARHTLSPAPRDALEAACRALGAVILGADAPRLPNTVTALFDVPGDLLVMGLDLEGVAASTGSACSSGAAKPSHVVEAMGLSGVPLRLSTGWDTPSQIPEAVAALRAVVARTRAAVGEEPCA